MNEGWKTRPWSEDIAWLEVRVYIDRVYTHTHTHTHTQNGGLSWKIRGQAIECLECFQSKESG